MKLCRSQFSFYVDMSFTIKWKIYIVYTYLHSDAMNLSGGETEVKTNELNGTFKLRK